MHYFAAYSRYMLILTLNIFCTNSNLTMLDGDIGDVTIWKIADVASSKTMILGLALGFTSAEVRCYDASNRIGGIVTSEGTFWMLVDWKNKTPVRKRCSQMKEALETADLAGIADEMLNKEGAVQHEGTLLLIRIPLMKQWLINSSIALLMIFQFSFITKPDNYFALLYWMVSFKIRWHNYRPNLSEKF